MKVTDVDYFLPEILPLNFIDVLSSGTTMPILIRGICKRTHVKSDYVVKLVNSPRMSASSLCNELIASLIGIELDLNIVEPAVVWITDEFAGTLKGKNGYRNVANSIGLNFGCKYLPGLVDFVPGQQLKDELYLQANEVFSFDVFISNSDRRVDKPNMSTDGEKILLYDHELAFGFVLDLIKNTKPWIISDAEKGWIRNHYFYAILRENENHFDEFIDRLIVLDDRFWNELENVVPNEWNGRHFKEIKINLTALVQNRNIFKEQLKKILL